MYNKPKTLIIGGAGFIGSNIAEHFYEMGLDVTVIDGLLESTGGQKKNLASLTGKIKIYFEKIEEVQDLHDFIVESDLIIDCMAWTSHQAAIENPFYDLELNCKSHLHLIKNLEGTRNKNIIFLSSRGIYGRVEEGLINEKTPKNPIDIQGIHKLTAEGYYNLYSELFDYNVAILRIPNCFGKNQQTNGDDIGLVGSFIRDALLDNEIEVYGTERKRQVIFVTDVIDIIWLIAQKQWGGFVPINLSGYNIPISNLAEKIIRIAGSGKMSLKEVPSMIRNIDIGNAIIDESSLIKFIGQTHLENIDDALEETINYFKENMN